MAFRLRYPVKRRPNAFCIRSEAQSKSSEVVRKFVLWPFCFVAPQHACGSISTRMMTLEPPRDLAVGAEHAADAEIWRAVGLSRSGLSRFLQRAKAAVGLDGEVEVLLASDRTLRRLNRTFRGKDKATDVLSFPAADFVEGHAGDLAISLDTAKKQATEQGHTLRDEVRVLLLHGLLHLSGMDHETDGGEMAEREGVLRVKLRLPNGLIARVEGKTARAMAAKEERKGRKGRLGRGHSRVMA
jgi:probable rRNA maturation factor